MTIAIENASSELVDIFAEIHNLLSSHGFREKVGRMNLIHKKSANNAIKEGPRPSANSREEWFCQQGCALCVLWRWSTLFTKGGVSTSWAPKSTYPLDGDINSDTVRRKLDPMYLE